MHAVKAGLDAGTEWFKGLDTFKKWMTVALVVHGAAVVALIKLLPD